MTGLAARAPKTLIFEWEQGAELPVDILETGGQIEIVIMQARRAHFYMHYTAAMCACAACRFAMLHNETAAAVYAGLSRGMRHQAMLPERAICGCAAAAVRRVWPLGTASGK